MAFTAVVAASWRLYRSIIGRLIFLFMLLHVVALAVEETLIAVARDAPDAVTILLGLFNVLVGVLLGSALVSATCMVVVSQLNGTSTSGIEALLGLPRKRELLAAGLFLGMLTMVLATLLPPEFSASILWVLYGPLIVAHIIVVERASLQEAWARAKQLWERHMVRIFLYLFCIAILILLLQGLLGALVYLSIFEDNAQGVGVDVVGAGLSVLLQSLFLPFLAIAATVMYLELRARKEDLTLEGLQEEWRATRAARVATQD